MIGHFLKFSIFGLQIGTLKVMNDLDMETCSELCTMKSVPKRGSVGSDQQLRLVRGMAYPTLPRFGTDFMTP